MNEISNNELSSYLQEINAQEAAELPKDLRGSKAWVPWTTIDEDGTAKAGVRSKTDLLEKSKQTQLANKALKKQKKREIIQRALSDTFIDLNAPLTVEHKKLAIQLETAKYTEKMEYYESYINSVFEKYILRHTPEVVKRCWLYYPEWIVPLEPFNYQASEDFGNGNTFKVNVTAPRIYSPQELLEEMSTNEPRSLIAVDKFISKFYLLKESQSVFETRMADKLLNAKTFYALLEISPFWYETLINKLKENATPIEQSN